MYLSDVWYLLFGWSHENVHVLQISFLYPILWKQMFWITIFWLMNSWKLWIWRVSLFLGVSWLQNGVNIIFSRKMKIFLKFMILGEPKIKKLASGALTCIKMCLFSVWNVNVNFEVLICFYICAMSRKM